MIHTIFRNASLIALLCLPAGAFAHEGNYYVHYECDPQRNATSIRLFMSDTPPIERAQNDMGFDVLASSQRVFECQMSSGDDVFFETVYGSPEGKYGHVQISINNSMLDHTLVYDAAHSEGIRITSAHDHQFETSYSDEYETGTLGSLSEADLKKYPQGAK